MCLVAPVDDQIASPGGPRGFYAQSQSTATDMIGQSKVTDMIGQSKVTDMIGQEIQYAATHWLNKIVSCRMAP